MTRCVFYVFTDTPGWFVDEAYNHQLSSVVKMPKTRHDLQCVVSVYGKAENIDYFIHNLKDMDYYTQLIEKDII